MLPAHILSINEKTPAELFREIALRARDQRLKRKLTQEGLAQRAGISLGSLKRFERSGQVSFLGLLKIAFALDCMKEFEALFSAPMAVRNLADLLKKPKARKRGSIK